MGKSCGHKKHNNNCWECTCDSLRKALAVKEQQHMEQGETVVELYEKNEKLRDALEKIQFSRGTDAGSINAANYMTAKEALKCST